MYYSMDACNVMASRDCQQQLKSCLIMMIAFALESRHVCFACTPGLW